MATGDMPNTCMCLREARIAAGYQNISQAGVAVHRSKESVGRHERGDVMMQAEDAIEYASAYDCPEILMAYCGECQIRQELFGKQNQREDSLPQTAIRVSNRLRNAAKYADTLAEILDDGIIDVSEVKDLQQTLDVLQGIEIVWREVLEAGFRAGIITAKKDRPAGTGTIYATVKSAHHSKL